MITGIVNANLEPTIPLLLVGPTGQQMTIEAGIDTGFSESLIVPLHIIVGIGLVYHSRRRALLANGAVVEFDAYRGTVIWNGISRRILVQAADFDALVGMRLLFRHEVKFQVIVGGIVHIETLP